MLSHAQVPANDGGLALGQAAIGAARLIDEPNQPPNQGMKRVMCLGIPGRIVEIDDAASKLATVDVGGVRRQVNIACIVDDEHPVESCVGDWVLVHVGFAMSRIDEAEAAETLRILTELGEAQAEIEAMRLSAARKEPTRCRTQADLRALYPFLHGARRTPAQLDAALLHSVEEKAREFARDQRSASSPTHGADSGRRRQARSPTSTAAAAGCSRWAMAARAATPRTSRSSSCIRSRPGGRRSRRSISSPTSR